MPPDGHAGPILTIHAGTPRRALKPWPSDRQTGQLTEIGPFPAAREDATMVGAVGAILPDGEARHLKALSHGPDILQGHVKGDRKLRSAPVT